MSQRSIEVFFKAQESGEKFDYFVCGVAGALFAYIGRDYVPRKLGLGISSVEPLALIFLVTSFYCGIKRIEWANQVKNLNHQRLDAAERAGNAIEALAKAQGSSPFYNAQGGDIMTVETLKRQHADNLQIRDELTQIIDKLGRKVNRFYAWRNRFLMFGFIAILAAKILQPYSATPLNEASTKPAGVQPTNAR